MLDPSRLAQTFCLILCAAPAPPCARAQWIELMQQAGAKYCVFVTKHHPDGFCMFDSAPAGIRPRHPARIGFLDGPLP